ncbi:alpha/beta fold hydrolase [Reyranella sp. CPCC 100927]|uniref:alpha/beta fold hydrolase n=1 Tax=Reyranella sp. CPCC 100927 TaxID=2599616 RepID=UPI0015B4C09F|nr:alpha/beta hydrolase [Reyranella sp. CPCC 100927]
MTPSIPRTFVCLSGAWMGGWSWTFVADRLRAAGHIVFTPTFRGLAERAHELSAETSNESCVDDAIACLADNDLRDVVLVGHSFGSLIAGLVVDRAPGYASHLVIIDGGIPRDGQSIFGRIPQHIADKRQRLATEINGVKVLPFAPVTSLIIDDSDLAQWTHRQLTPHPLRCYVDPIRLHNPPGNGVPMTYIACVKPRYPVSAGNHERVQAMPDVRFRPIEAGHNCIISAPDLVAAELLAVP